MMVILRSIINLYLCLAALRRTYLAHPTAHVQTNQKYLRNHYLQAQQFWLLAGMEVSAAFLASSLAS